MSRTPVSCLQNINRFWRMLTNFRSNSRSSLATLNDSTVRDKALKAHSTEHAKRRDFVFTVLSENGRATYAFNPPPLKTTKR